MTTRYFALATLALLTGCAANPQKLCAEMVPDTYWYRTGEARLMACTLGKGARDNCTLSVNEFVRMGGEWSPGFSDGVMCNVTDVNRVRSPPPSRFASRRL